jgi:hypothetical protein
LGEWQSGQSQKQWDTAGKRPKASAIQQRWAKATLVAAARRLNGRWNPPGNGPLNAASAHGWMAVRKPA